MDSRKFIFSLILAFATATSSGLVACSSVAKEVTAAPVAEPAVMQTFDTAAVNSPAVQASPYVVMLSLDGYRYDYNKLYSPPALNAIASQGVAAASMMPIYPSKTFPNHYSIVTGLYADHHGIVSNDFYDPARDAAYALSDRKAVADGSWYQGDPLWIAAEKQGMLTASFFWVGSEANIQGKYPNYYYKYDDSVPKERRVEQALEWLRMPADRRPHLITLYFDDVDTASHEFGTNSEKTREAVLSVDAAIAKLRDGLAATGLPVNLIVVSDHGMIDLDPSKVILIDQNDGIKALLAKFRVVGRGPQMSLYLNKGEDPALIVQLQKALRKGAKNYRVHRRDELKAFHYSAIPRVGDLVIEPDAPYVVGVSSKLPSTAGANHGWDPKKTKAMHGIFYAEGPAFRDRTQLSSFENIHVYPMVLEILGLKPVSPIDGKLSVLKPSLEPAKH